MIAIGLTVGALLVGVQAQLTPPSSWPFSYPGQPNTTYGPDWQDFYRVDSLPYAPALPNSTFAGSVSVNRDGHPNNTLFFVAFEKEAGSLTAAAGERSDEPWMIWLNGGPGSSSLYGLFSEHGPLHFGLAAEGADPATVINVTTMIPPIYLAITSNPFSWHQLTSIFYIDQPVGTGWSTSDTMGYIADEDQMGSDFVGFLSNLVSVFPSLKSRPLYLTGESYAGTYIPYITKTIINTASPPVNLTKITIGDGAVGNFGAYEEYSMTSILQSWPQLINFETSTYEYFVDQYNLCGYNLTLTYPSESTYPTLKGTGYISGNISTTYAGSDRYKARYSMDMGQRQGILKRLAGLDKRDIIHERDHIIIGGEKFAKRQTTNSTVTPPPLAPTGVINPYYQCFLMEQVWDYAVNYTEPWKHIDFDVYRISDALYPEAPDNPAAFLNIPAVRQALHAPSKNWLQSFTYPFNNTYQHAAGNVYGDPSPEPQVFISNLTSHVPMIFYSGNDDSLVAHRGTELAIQNMTFGGIRGFTARPSTPFYDDNGTFAGIVHQERNVSYLLFDQAGHMVPAAKPQAAYAFIRDFVLGSNTTGLLTTPTTNSTSGSPTAAPNPTYLKGIIEGSVAYTGLYRTQGTYTWPQASWDAWHSYMATRTAADVPVASASGDGVIGSGARSQTTGNEFGAANAGERNGCALGLVTIVGVLVGAGIVW